MADPARAQSLAVQTEREREVEREGRRRRRNADRGECIGEERGEDEKMRR